ncbi:hypothetical protein [Frankia sp. Cas4]|uniref:hypothetical protein n=1 Tax=Frankia sp. Cas4 TaxID=3073927 RepID=UPI002AD38F87|nr:hypothetical protein [Frankia sp. Cas4]
MRTHFEPEQQDEFDAAKELLIRRCTAWANHQQVAADPFILTAALEFRHHSVDGRLAYWTVDLAREFLLGWVPRRLSVTADDAVDAAGTLLTLLRYLRTTDLDDPACDPLPEIEAALTAIDAEFRHTMSDEQNFSIAKFWVMRAIASGVDPTDAVAMTRFTSDARAGRVEHDQEALRHVIARQLGGAGELPQRACIQLPVSIPPTNELAAMAEENRLVRQLRALTDWVGHAGRPLTTTGQLKLADARELVTLVDTGDTIDPIVGGRVWRTKSSADLPGLTLIVEWAKKLRLIRVVKSRLVQIAKSQPLLLDGLALWTMAINTFAELADAVVRPRLYGHRPGMLHDLFEEIAPDLLNTIYGMPAPVPVVRLGESMWTSCQAAFAIDDADESQQEIWRTVVGGDLRRILRVLAAAGGVELSTGPVDPMFRSDLGDDVNGGDEGDFGGKLGGDFDPEDDVYAEENPTGNITVLPPDARERLSVALAADAGPVETVVLTPLGTYAVRIRLLAEGRHMPLVGELSDAAPAQLLGMIAQYHTPETGQEEISRWLAAHGGADTGLDQLLDAVRRCPFRNRAAAMLDVLAAAQPDRRALLRRLRSDTVLGPIAVHHLVSDEELSPDDLTEPEGLLIVTEQLLQLLEIAGPDAVRESFAKVATGETRDLFTAVLHSGHPDTTGLDELRTLVIEPLQRRGPLRSARARSPRSPRRSRPPGSRPRS